MRKRIVKTGLFIGIVSAIGLFLLATSVVAEEKGIIGSWDFDEGEGEAAKDSSPYSNHGTIHGATWGKCKHGSALSFDGMDDYVQISGLDASSGNITIEAWIKQTGNKTNIIPVSLTGGPGYLRFQLHEHFQFKNWDGRHALCINYGGRWEKNKGYHMVGTISNKTAKLYINGNLVGSRTKESWNDAFVLSSLEIGSFDKGRQSLFDGIIDEVKVYNRALTAEEVKANYKPAKIAEIEGIEVKREKKVKPREIEKATKEVGVKISKGEEMLTAKAETLPVNKDAWTENIENWKGDNLTLDTDAMAGKYSLKIISKRDKSGNFTFQYDCPQPLDLSAQKYCYVWSKRKGVGGSWQMLILKDINGKVWKSHFLLCVPRWHLLEFRLDKKPTGGWAKVDEGFDFSKVNKITLLLGNWWDVGANMWIDGLHFSKEIVKEEELPIPKKSFVKKTELKLPVSIGTGKQLFIDELFIEDKENVKLTVNPPVKTGDRAVIVGDKPWEDAKGRCPAYFTTVMEDGGLYKMWYNAATYPNPEKGIYLPWHERLCYATSKDGINWTKPNLGIVEFEGSKENNIVIGTGSGVVFKDPTAPDGERYKCFGLCTERGKGVYLAVSPDGLHWSPFSEDSATPQYSDTFNIAFWDNQLKKYVAYVRSNVNYREVARMESPDCKNWTEPVVVLERDPLPLVTRKNEIVIDIYNSSAIKYPYAPNTYFMFPSIHHPGRGKLHVEFAASRDGIRWKRYRVPFIPLGPKSSFDWGCIYAAEGFLRVKDEIWMYYTGTDGLHGVPRHSGISRVKLRVDGYISIDAGKEGGYLTTVPLTFSGNHLELNVNSKEGLVRVEILDKEGKEISGFTKAEADPIQGDYISKTASWKGRSNLSSLAGKQVKLRFWMKEAKLYSFCFSNQHSLE